MNRRRVRIHDVLVEPEILSRSPENLLVVTIPVDTYVALVGAARSALALINGRFAKDKSRAKDRTAALLNRAMGRLGGE